MENLLIAVIAGLLILLASVASVELGVSVALIEISFGVVAGNFLGLTSPPWMDFLASFGSILLTFLAGAEVDPRVMRQKFKESLLIGGLSFVAPFVGAWLFCAWVLGWSTPAAQIAGVALSTTSLAVVYAVLVETGLTLTPIGKLIMASTFVTDFGTALALALLFIQPTWWLVPFLGVSVLIIWAMVALQPWFFARYGERVIEPEIKGAVAALLVLMYFADKAQSHAVLPAFVLGLAGCWSSSTTTCSFAGSSAWRWTIRSGTRPSSPRIGSGCSRGRSRAHSSTVSWPRRASGACSRTSISPWTARWSRPGPASRASSGKTRRPRRRTTRAIRP